MARDPSWHQKRRQERLARIDAMSPDLRACVHDYGYSTVDMLMSLGITRPRQIRHVVEHILDQFSPTRGCYSNQGITRAPGYKETVA